MQGKNKPENGFNHSQPGNQHSDREREMVCGHRGSEQMMLMMQCSTVRSDPERCVTCPLRRGCPSVPLHTQTCLRLKQLLFLCVSEMQSKGQASVESNWSRVRQRAGTTYFMTTEKNRHSKRFCICGSTCTALLFLVRWCSYHRVRGHYNYTTQAELIHWRESSPKNENSVIIYLPSRHFKCVWLTFFCRTQKKVFWKMSPYLYNKMKCCFG